MELVARTADGTLWVPNKCPSWVWASSGSQRWTGWSGILQSTGLQRVGHNWVTELIWSELNVIGKAPDAGKDWRWEEKGKTVDEMVGWHHWLNGHEFEQVLGVGDGQGGLACCSPWGCEELDTTEQLNWNELKECLWMEWVMGWIYLELPLAGVRGVRMEMLMGSGVPERP